jgi:hypothetical protein
VSQPEKPRSAGDDISKDKITAIGMVPSRFVLELILAQSPA